MPSSKTNKSVLVTGAVLSLASQALGHMEMSWPYPLHSKYNPANSYNVIDYSMTSPLVADGSNFPCKGYQNDRPFTPVITYSAGSSYNMTLAGSASHGGGSCQLSLSYDNGATFRVIKSMIGGCPLTSTYDFTIPSYAPNGDALFAWTWQNEQGNREFYMNCAQVAITGSSASKKRDTSTFEALPFIWKANIAGINTCTTTEGEDPVYPQPGPDVQYGGSMSSSSSASTKAGVCDAATPFGQTYKDLGDTAEPQTATVGGGSAATTIKTSSKSSAAASSSKVPTTLQSTTKTSAVSSSSSSTKASSSAQSSAANTVKSSSSNTASTVVTFSSVNAGKSKSSSTTSAPSSSATSDDDDCPSDVTLTVYTTSGASAKTSVSTASATTSSSGSSSTAPTDPDTEYATGDLSTYLPCVPGTYICTSVSTWVTCDTTMYSDGSTSWVYRDARTLSNGAHCVPSFSPYSSSTKAYAQQADSPAGFYRDDRIAYSTGNSCAENGDVQCVGTGAFDMCADNVWYNMGAVASGTTCSNGALVAGS